MRRNNRTSKFSRSSGMSRQARRLAMFRKKPECSLRAAGIEEVDYKDISLLRRHVTDEWKIQPGRINNVSAGMQRQLKTAIKRARFLALIPYTDKHHIHNKKDK